MKEPQQFTPDFGSGNSCSPLMPSKETEAYISLLQRIGAYLAEEHDRQFTDRVQLMLFRITADLGNNLLAHEINNFTNATIAERPRFCITKNKITDFIKIISAMYDIHLFSKPDGYIADKKQDLMNYIGAIFGLNLSGYSQMQNSGKQGSKDYMKVFESLTHAALKYSMK
ncbi:MAG: hypothetical protein IKH86_11325 [Prevotella sp.]|nr:hypothetical protein [Prevotella sp.]